MHRLLRSALLLPLVACATADLPTCEDGPTPLFGAPNAATGLSNAQCAGTCTCGGEPWSPRALSGDELARWRTWTLLDGPSIPTADPYAGEVPAPADEGAVCAVHREGDDAYRLRSHPTAREAERAGGAVTHLGGCGLCSSLADLAVYAERPDLTEPVRACGLEHLTGPPEAHVACLRDLGFTEPCAWIWYYNTLNTRRLCAADCFAAIDDPYHLPDGALNACLQCDEVQSGPVFQAVAGRTRRNTGLASSMCRPCSEVRPIDHAY
jgi:hypothetical protein